ncbi:phosphomannomutase [Rhizobium sp. DKSPLA3]|uniref:Phosphomannomutase n=1 Tax=Rhizobium quercicola TaxID=2901226 RepID=A0A9X1NUG7_9HYPH|nr:phosphomannomutase [Rhizobium quercicola]MCD7111420.1 phosphomannomutase [Rhizobium quercicola]
MSLKFGTSGLRGLSVDLNGPAAALYATAFARYLIAAGHARKGDVILVARDFRPSSTAISSIIIGALIRAGFEVRNCGTVPTPALALYALHVRSAALMVTGSHIPADRNGIKFYTPDGEIRKEDEEAISREADALRKDGNLLDETPADAFDIESDVRALFVERNATLLGPNALSKLKIGVYEHSTVARDIFTHVLKHYGAEVVLLGRSDIFVPVDTEAVSFETVTALRAWASEHQLDAIISADGDGDRPLVSDELGNPIRGDLLGLITAEFLGASVAVTPVTSNSGLERRGTVKFIRTRVGSPFVISGMEAERGTDVIIGFEANGGTLTVDPSTVNGTALAPLPTRDSLLPILAALQLRASREQPFSAIVRSFSLPVASSNRLENFSSESSLALMTKLRSGQEALTEFLLPIGIPVEVSDIDGLRVTLSDGSIIHLRPSGNAPEMRCYVEADTEEKCRALLQRGLELLDAWRLSLY